MTAATKFCDNCAFLLVSTRLDTQLDLILHVPRLRFSFFVVADLLLFTINISRAQNSVFVNASDSCQNTTLADNIENEMIT